MQSSKLALWCLPLVLLTGAGCGDSKHGAAQRTGKVQDGGRLTLTSNRAPEMARAAVAVRSLIFGRDSDEHTLRAGTAELRPHEGLHLGEVEWHLALGSEGRHSIEFLTPPGTPSFQRVAMEVLIRRPTTIQAFAVMRDGRRHHSQRVFVGPDPGHRAVLLDLPQLRLEQESPRHVAVSLTSSERGQMRLYRVDWLAQPVEGWLPQAGASPRHIELNGESRPAIGMTGTERLGARFLARSGELLSFGYCVPLNLGVDSQDVQLQVRLTGGGQEFETSYPLASLEEESSWQDVHIELDRFAGQEVELVLTMVGPEAHRPICALTEVRVRAPRARAPLVFLLTSDTHRADHVGVADLGVEIHTPELDALAERGVWFGNCFSSTNVTNPSHVTLMTGVHVRDHGVVSNTMGVGAQAFTLAQAFRDAGWATFGVVSNISLGPRSGGLERGFERFAVPARNPGAAAEAVDRMLEWWSAADGVPLFCWLHVFDAHMPYGPPDPSLVELYYPAEKDPFDPSLPPLEGVQEQQLPPDWQGLRDLAWARAMYRAEISYLDRELGRLLRQPRFEEAIVACTSDHGETLDTHDTLFAHADLFSSNLHVPLILTWPEAPAGLRVDAPVEQAWLGRTLLNMSGFEEVQFPGQDLRDYMSARPPPARPRFALAASRVTASVTVWPWHLTLHLTQHSHPRGTQPNVRHAVRLFDLESDPACLNDLVASGEEVARARRLREILVEWCNSGAEVGLVGIHNQSAEVVAELARLGYAADMPAPTSRELIAPNCTCEWCLRFL